jgi:hypothetical protein
MKRDYKTAAESMKAGYLQRRMALYRAQVAAELAQKAANEAQAAKEQQALDAKVTKLKAAHG